MIRPRSDRIDRKKLALVHIVKKELGLSDEDYRRLLREAAGVNSAKELDDMKFRKLMNYFVRSPHYRVNAWGLTLRQKLFIKFMAKDLGWDDKHLDNFIRKYYHKPGIDRLNRREAMKAIESLKNIKSRGSQPASNPE